MGADLVRPVVWLVGILILLGSFAPSARAQDELPPLGQDTWHTWADPPAVLDAALAAADASWRTEDGVAEGNYCHVEWRWHSGLPLAGAIVSYCVITWSDETVTGAIASASDATVGSERHEALVRLCATIKHERGHMLGYPDYGAQGGGIMTAAVWSLRPLRCVEWADSLVPGVAPAPLPPSAAPTKGLSALHVVMQPCTVDCKAKARAFTRRRKAARWAR